MTSVYLHRFCPFLDHGRSVGSAAGMVVHGLPNDIAPEKSPAYYNRREPIKYCVFGSVKILSITHLMELQGGPPLSQSKATQRGKPPRPPILIIFLMPIFGHAPRTEMVGNHEDKKDTSESFAGVDRPRAPVAPPLSNTGLQVYYRGRFLFCMLINPTEFGAVQVLCCFGSSRRVR